MKTKDPETALDWESLPLQAVINSEDERVRRNAEEVAFRILWHHGMVYVKGTVACSQYDAKDMVQEAIIAWMEFVRRLGLSDDSPEAGSKSHKGLFYTILKCKIANWLRKLYKREELHAAHGANAHPQDPGAWTGSFGEREIYALNLIDDLDPESRSIVLMKSIGYSSEKIAKELGIPSGTVRSRLCRVRNTIRQRVEDKFGPLPKDEEPKEGNETEKNQAAATDPPAKVGGPAPGDEGEQP